MQTKIIELELEDAYEIEWNMETKQIEFSEFG